MTFDGFDFAVTGTSTFTGAVTILGDTITYSLTLQPDALLNPSVNNGAIFYDVGSGIINQDGTYLKLGETFNNGDTIQSQIYGGIYCLSGNSLSGRTWVQSDASAVSTSTGLLGVGIFDGVTESGLLLRGFINVPSSAFSGTDIPGAPLYLSIVSGRYSFDPPTNTGEIVRIVGYFNQAFQDANLDILYNIYFNPSNDWIEL
jgi:hypothetical protein